ncbi:cell division protein ZapE [Pseudomonas sp. KNUC1026]|uniref:cell division protein ZapE n=1 Tax=Pseudomonas sp. KNUC1026 TaxID=2893890 RepID=UPI0022A75794|nr:cell division protein ZapE [Pseudomonas sp. KNUC1026]
MPHVNAEAVIADIQAQAQRRGYTLDEQQNAAVIRLGELAAALSPAWLERLKKPKGVYIWGPVGRGKSFLLDAFFSALPITEKRRVHFHAFFRELHERQFQHSSSEHAMEEALEEMLHGCKLLCFDEFHLHDIGDAMLITRFFKALFKRDCLLLTTSNYAPEGLLPNPLYHERFLPSIRLIEARMDVLSIAGGVDYRTLATAEPDPFGKGAFVSPADAGQRQALGLPGTPRRPSAWRSTTVKSKSSAPPRAPCTCALPTFAKRPPRPWTTWR